MTRASSNEPGTKENVAQRGQETQQTAYQDSGVSHRFWTLWQYKHSHKTGSSSGCHCHRLHCRGTKGSTPLQLHSLVRAKGKHHTSRCCEVSITPKFGVALVSPLSPSTLDFTPQIFSHGFANWLLKVLNAVICRFLLMILYCMLDHRDFANHSMVTGIQVFLSSQELP